jgi:hypothetical protein
MASAVRSPTDLAVGGHRDEGDLAATGGVDELQRHLDAVAVGLVEDELAVSLEGLGCRIQRARVGRVRDLLHADDDVHGMVTVIDYGDRAGFGFAALLAAGIPSGVIYASARAAAAVGNSAPRGLTGLWNAPDHIGLAPERLLRTQVEAPLHALTGQSTGFPVLAKLRGLAKAVVAISLIVTAVAALTFVAAAFDGWDRYWNGCPSGGVRMSDGSCFVLGGP